MTKAQKNVQARNKKATFNVAINETIEAGIVLTGDEIKAVRADRMQLTGSYVKLMKGSNGVSQPVLIGLHLSIAAEPQRTRALLLHSKEILMLEKALHQDGVTAVPTRLYLKRGWAKVEIGIGKGRKNQDKRSLLRDRDINRDQDRFLKGL